MKDDSSQPAAPDYLTLANQQANNQAKLTRYNQVTPTGASTWTTDANGNWTNLQALSPNQQALLTQQEGLSKQMNTLAGSQLNNVSSALGSGIDFASLPSAPINAGQTAQDAIMSRLSPQFDRDEAKLKTQLANQGIGLGTEAYNEALDQFGRNKNDAMIQAGLQGINTGYNARNQALQESAFKQNQPLNVLNALRSGGSVSMPSFNNMSTPNTADLTGAANSAYNAQIGNYNANTASNNALMGGLFSLGGSALQSGFWK